MNKILVTGSNGFIGSHLIDKLLEMGCSVKCVLRKTSNMRWIKGQPFNCVYADFRDPETLSDAVKDVDEIYHLGGIIRVVRNKMFYETNSAGTRNLVEAVKKYNPDIKKFVYVSSQAAFGPAGKGPVSHYGKSKAEGEEWVKELGNYSIVRPVAVYGPRDMDFLDVFKMAMKGFFLKPRNSGKLSFIHVSDCIDGIIKAGVGTESFLSDGNNYNWYEVCDIMGKVMSRNIKCIEIPASIIGLIGIFGTVAGRLKGSPLKLNYDKTREMLGGDWVVPESAVYAKYDLEKGFKHTYKWYCEMGLL